MFVSIALLFALNDTFVLSMKVFLISLLDSNPNFIRDIILLSDGNLSEKSFAELKEIYPNIRRILAKKEDYVNCLPTVEKWGYNLYYRFDVFEMGELGYDRIIIMDSDMVVLKNIDDLFTCTNDFAACQKHLGIPEIAPNDPNEYKKKRFNCGLMSISSKLMNPLYKEKLIRLATEKSWTSDQPVFNVCFERKVFYLPQKYNVVTSIATKENLEAACIVQYHGFVQPWHSDDPNKCFEGFVKDEITNAKEDATAVTLRLKNLFDSYVARVKI